MFDARVDAAVRRFLPLVWRVLRRAGLRPVDADDAAQDVFWIFARRIQGIPERAERAFLVSTAMRVAADRRRSKWARAVTETIDPELRAPDAVSPERALELRRARALLDQALGALDTEQRQVFILVELEQLTREETAAALEVPPGTVASRLRRARELFDAEVRRIALAKGVRS